MSKTATSTPLPLARKIIYHPIAGDEEGGALFIFGDTNASNIAVLCAGYPDDHECFLPFGSRLASEANCLVGVTCIAGYDDREDRPWTDGKKEGYTFDEMTTSIKEAVKALRAESTNSEAQLIGIFHDWGVAPGSMYTNRTIEENDTELIPKKVVLFDVLMGVHPDMKDKPTAPKPTLFETVTTYSYRIVFASAYATQRYISKTLAIFVFLLPMQILGLLKLTPTLEIDAKTMQSRHKPIDINRMIYMAFPYYNLFKSLLKGTAKQDCYGMWLPKDLTTTPVLYMYGTEKRINFHDEAAKMVLDREEEEKRSQSKTIAVDNAGHWLYLQQPEICFEAVKKFIEDEK